MKTLVITVLFSQKIDESIGVHEETGQYLTLDVSTGFSAQNAWGDIF